MLKMLSTVCKHLIEAFSLGYSAGKAVEDEAADTLAGRQQSVTFGAPILAIVVLIQLVVDHVDHNLIADKTSLIHDLLCFSAELGLLCNLSSQHVSSGLKIVSKQAPFLYSTGGEQLSYQVAYGVFVFDPGCLGSLAWPPFRQ